MKKMLLFVIIFLMVIPSTLFAAKLSQKAQNEIVTFSNVIETMDYNQKILFYNQNKKSITAPLLLNIFLGCGIGSYVDGDTTGGTIGLVGELASLAVFYYGYRTALSSIKYSYTDYYDQGYSLRTRGYNIMYAGIISYAAFRIYEIVRTFTYNAEYNRQLQNSVYSTVQVGFAPIIENNEVKFSLAAKVSL